MNNQQYRSLPNYIRKAFDLISDDEFANHPEVVTARERAQEAEAEHHKTVQEGSLLRAKKAALEAKKDSYMHLRREVIENRLKRLAGNLIEGSAIDEEADISAIAEIRRLDGLVDAIPIALAEIDKRLAEIWRAVSSAVASLTSAQDALSGTVDKLKLEEAHKRAA